nr:unnamed protein product [Naegleria fowleri]
MKRSFDEALLGDCNHQPNNSHTTTTTDHPTTTTTTNTTTTTAHNVQEGHHHHHGLSSSPSSSTTTTTVETTTTLDPNTSATHQPHQAFSDPYHRITPLMMSATTGTHQPPTPSSSASPMNQPPPPQSHHPAHSQQHSSSSTLHRLAIHNATMNTVVQSQAIQRSSGNAHSNSGHLLTQPPPLLGSSQLLTHSPPSKKLKLTSPSNQTQPSSSSSPSPIHGSSQQSLPPNLPNLLPNLMGNHLPPLSNFLFTPPPFLQAVSRSRSNSSSSTNSTQNSSQPPTMMNQQRNRSNSAATTSAAVTSNLSSLPPQNITNPSSLVNNNPSSSSMPQKNHPSHLHYPHQSQQPVIGQQQTPVLSTHGLSSNQDQNARSQKLKETWVEVYKSLKKLEAFVSQKTTQSCTKPWENNEHVTLFTTIYDLCILPDSVYYEDQLYILYSIYIKKYLQTTIVPCLKDKHSEDLLNEIVFIWGNFRDIFVRFCSYIFKYLDQFYVVSNSKRTLKSEAFYSFKTVVFDGMKNTLRQIVLDKIDQDRKNFHSDASFYLSQRHLLRQTLELFIELDHSNFVPVPDGTHSIPSHQQQHQLQTRESSNHNNSSTPIVTPVNASFTNTTSLASTTPLFSSSSTLASSSSSPPTCPNAHHCEEYVEDFEKFAEKETREFYHKIAEDWIEKYNLTEYLLRAEDCIQQEQSRINAIFPTHFSQNKLMKIVDMELLKNKEQRLLEMSGSGVKILIRDEKIEDLKRLYRLMNRVEGGLEPVAELFKEHLIFVGNDLFSKYERATSEMIKGIQPNASGVPCTVVDSTSANSRMSGGGGGMSDTCNDTLSASSSSGSSCESSIISNEVYTKCVRFLIECYVIELMELHKKMKNIVNGPFCRNVIFHKAMSEGFKQFVNKNISLGQFEIRVVQLFAYYTDDILRKKTDDNLDSIVDFIQFFSDRDIFIEEYRKLFAVRLLVTDYQELEERMMISKLKYHYRGMADIYKLEKMLTDKTMANDMRQDFQNYITTHNIQLPYEVNVTVLTMGMWPLKAKEHMKLPNEIAESQTLFKRFYDDRNRLRVLKWVYSKSMVQLLAHYAKGNHLLELSTLQASILLLFNEHSSLTVKKIEEMTGLTYDHSTTSQTQQQAEHQTSTDVKPLANSSESQSSSSYSSDIDLKQAIASLTTEKLPLLIATSTPNANNSGSSSSTPSNSSGTSAAMTLTINEAFHNRLYKIKVPLPRVTQKDIQNTQASVSTDRTYILEACVVRVMKTRKTMNIQSLFNEVVTQLIPIFTPDVKQIKKRIESLIERDFLKRDEVNNTLIHYVA